jgi:iron(III) transport system ATP-binding protein
MRPQDLRLGDRKLEADSVTVSFAPGRPAVDGASLSLTCGRLTALLGPSGSGKSTLLRAIAGLERPSKGSVRFEGRAWSDADVHLAPEERRCGVVFQDYALFPHLNALDNVAYGLKGPKRDRRAKALEQLKAVELDYRASAFPHELSGGEQQRVALARALAPGPDVMLLDEPFSGLDRRLRAELRETSVAALRASEAATLLVTHDAEEALALADQIALMSEGRIIQTGAPDQLYLNPSSLAAARLLGDIEAFDARVHNGAADTPLGKVDAEGIEDGAAVTVLLRPEGVLVRKAGEDGALADVVDRRAAAGYARLVCRLETGREIQARAGLADSIRPGDAVRLSLDSHFVSVVSAQA